MKLSLSGRTLLLALAISLTSLTAGAQVIVTATAGNPGPLPYPDLASAFAAINAGTHQGVIGIGIASSTTETGPCVLNASGAGAASYTTIGISPISDNVTISGPTVSGRGLIELNGADNVTIDGDNPNTGGTNRNLTITNTAANTVTFTSCIRLATSTLITNADNVTIRNCNLNGSGTGLNNSGSTSETCTWGIIASGNASTTTNTTAPNALTASNTTIAAGQTISSLTITNNNIQTCSRAIAINGGNSSVAPNILINNNLIGNVTAGAANQVYGIGITGQGSVNGLISGNTVYIESFWGSSTVNKAIDLGTVSFANVGTWTIENNIVGRVRNNNPGTFNATGININGGTTNIIRNNFVTNLTNDQTAGTGAFSTAFGVMGIRLANGTNHQVYYNSVHLTGAIPGNVNTDLAACLFVTTTAVTGCDVRNNVFSDVLTGGNPAGSNTTFACIYLPPSATSALNLTLNNNVYYQGALSYSGIAQVGMTPATGFYTAANFNPAAITPATNLRSYTSTLSAAGTNDNASAASTAAAPFISATDLHVNLAAVNASDLDAKATVIAGTTLDIDLATRNAATPDIGADEFALATCSAANGGTISPATQSFCAGGTVTMTSTGATSGTGITYQWMVGATSGGPYSNVTGGSGANTTSYTTAALAAGTYYYVMQTTCSFGPLTGLSNEVLVTVHALPTVTVNPSTATYCNPGTPVTLSASGAIVYVWGPSAGLSATSGSSVDASPAVTTTYTVVGTDINGCIGNATTTITSAPAVTGATASATPGAVCAGSTTDLSALANPVSAVILNENFNSGAPSWTRTNNSTGGTPANAAWTNRPDGYVYAAGTPYHSNDNSQFVQTNSDAQGSGSTTNTMLQSPAFSTSGYTNISVDFYQYYRDIADPGDSAVVEASLNATNWTIVTAYTANTGAENAFTHPSVTLPASFDNQPTVYIRFRYVATWDWYWSLDNVTVSGLAQNFTYNWSSTPSGFSSTLQNPTGVMPAVATTYSVQITNAYGCSATASASVTINPLPTVTASSTASTVCAGDAVTVTGSGAVSYSWTGGVNDGVPFNPAATNTYTVTGTDSNGCTNTDMVTVNVNALPVVNLGPDVTQCAGSVTFDAQNAGSSYLWNDASIGQTLTVSSSGTFDVAVTDGNGCVGRDTVMATINPLPVVNLGPDVTQCGGPVILDAQNAGSSYLWNDASMGQTLSVSTSGTYDVAVTDGNGCVGRDTAMVTINPLPVVNLGPDVTQCGSVTLDAQNVGSSYLWNDATMNQTLTVTSTGTYNVTVTDTNGCSNSDTATITINPLPVVNLGADISLCPGDSAVLDAQNVGSSYLWSDSSINQTLTVNSTGSYYVTVTDGNGCSNSDTVMATLHSNPTVNIGPDVTQCGGTVTLDAQNAGSAYLWNDATINQTIDVTSTGTYYVTVTDVNGCTGSDTAMITINTPPNVTFTFGTNSMCINDANLTLSGGSPAGGVYSGPGVSGTTFNALTAGVGNQPVTYTYTDVNGCSGNAVHTIVVDSCLAISEPTLDQAVNLYPNPNNGVFQVSVGSGNYSTLTVEVFTVQGQLIFSDKASDAGAGYTRTIDLSTFANGSYVVKITTDKETAVRKVVMQD